VPVSAAALAERAVRWGHLALCRDRHTALVTGASHGIGAATAAALSASGASVAREWVTLACTLLRAMFGEIETQGLMS
jgi:hypothetical protein